MQLPVDKIPRAKNCYWVYPIILLEQQKNAADVIKNLRDLGIGSRPFFYPMHQQPVLKQFGFDCDHEQYPVAESIADKGFYIPLSLSLSIEQQKCVVDALVEVIDES